MPMYSEPSETYKMKLIILPKSHILDAREEIFWSLFILFICFLFSSIQAYYCIQQLRAFLG